MKRYESRPRAAWVQGEDAYQNDYRPSPPPSLTVFEQEPSERRTGLLDHHGNPIVSIEQMAPIGFGRSKE
jgi:hypothetical protein